MSLTDDIKYKALESGFDIVGITDTSPIDAVQLEILSSWLQSGFAGQMDYMHRNLEIRTNPAKILENARSIIIVGLNYKPPKQELVSAPQEVPTGKIVSYAQYEDYHQFIRNRLCQLIDFISTATGQNFRFKICVDSAPLAERTLAARAGLGFIGKNHMLINPKLGCQIFLGEIITDLKLLPDKPMPGDCSNCKRCIENCPTGALRSDGQFDANRCINYLTIEYKGEISPEIAETIDGRLFGCEECILACPYQKDAPVCKNKYFEFHKDNMNINLPEILSLSTESFEEKFHNSPIKRPGLEILKRNARICLSNTTSTG